MFKMWYKIYILSIIICILARGICAFIPQYEGTSNYGEIDREKSEGLRPIAGMYIITQCIIIEKCAL